MNAPTAPDGAAPSEQAPLLNIANALTVLRLLLVPVFIWLSLLPGDRSRLAAVVVFVVAAFTDRLDGQLARSWGLVTSFGKIADPIADKSLMAAALIGLAVVGEVPWWVPVIILVRELGITVLRFFMIRIAVMPASRGGKIKTVLQTAAIALFLLIFPLSDVVAPVVYTILLVIAWIIMTAAIVVTIVTGVDYCIQAAKLARAAHAGEAGAPAGNADSGGKLGERNPGGTRDDGTPGQSQSDDGR